MSGQGGPPDGEWFASVPQQREGGSSVLPPPRSLDLPPSDAELIAQMREGDDSTDSAYEELFRRHSDAVRRYARTCCRDAHTADDLTAEVFARTLQAVRGGAGPEQAVRAYLLTTVRRVAAAWTKTAKREQLVEDFALFADQAARSSSSEVSDQDTLDLGADVQAMRIAEKSLAMEAFRSLPERWQAVLWHTTVEEESPSDVAPLFGLTANATAVLASRAREGLKQAYLQAHVSQTLTAGGDCAQYADRLGAYARGGLRMRAERGCGSIWRSAPSAGCRGRAEGRQLRDSRARSGRGHRLVRRGSALKAAGLVAGGAAGAALRGRRVGRRFSGRRGCRVRRARHAREGRYRSRCRRRGGRRSGVRAVGQRRSRTEAARGAPRRAACRTAQAHTAATAEGTARSPGTRAQARPEAEARAGTPEGRAQAPAPKLLPPHRRRTDPPHRRSPPRPRSRRPRRYRPSTRSPPSRTRSSATTPRPSSASKTAARSGSAASRSCGEPSTTGASACTPRPA